MDPYHPIRESYLAADDATRQRLQALWTEAAGRTPGWGWPYERPCVVCGAVFRYPHRGLRVCSQACALARAAAQRRHARQRSAVRLHPYTRTCTQCGQPFTATRSDATTCSARCRTALQRARAAQHDRTAAG
jgi:predicted nucleic acid-binding Zn ribbon protein